MEKTSECEIAIDSENQKKRADALTQKIIDKALNELQNKVNNSSQKDLLAGKPLVLWHAIDEMPSTGGGVKNQLLKVSFKPFCLLPKTANLKPYEKKLSSKLVNIEQEIPEYVVLETLDEYLRYAIKLQESKKKISLKLTPKDLLKKRAIAVRFNDKDLSLNLCSEIKLKQQN